MAMTISDQVDPNEMTILGHLNELRRRLTWVLAVLAVATVISLTFTGRLLEWLKRPYPFPLETLSPQESIQTYFKVALVAGAVLAMPMILLQIWLFVAPALERNEKLYAFLFIVSAMILFGLGVWFTWGILLPTALEFLRTFQGDIFIASWTSQEYYSFVATFTFWLGVSFEMPIVVYFLGRFGVVSARTMWVQWRLAIVIIAVIAAAVTPTIDPVTMLLTMAPLMLLYFVSIGLAHLGNREFQRTAAD